MKMKMRTRNKRLIFFWAFVASPAHVAGNRLHLGCGYKWQFEPAGVEALPLADLLSLAQIAFVEELRCLILDTSCHNQEVKRNSKDLLDNWTKDDKLDTKLIYGD
jgi:hypothetical protein